MKKKIIIIAIIIIVLGVIIYNLLPTKIAVLTYHDFVESNIENNMQITYDLFEKEMAYLSKHNYKTITTEELECFIKKECKLSKKSVLITFDDGWKGELKAIDILEKYNMKATIFYIGSNLNNVNFMNANDINDIQQNHKNITLASHSYDLHYEDAYKKSYEDISNDFYIMRNIIDSKYFAYPYGLYSDDYKKVLKDNDYNLAFTFGPNKEHRKVSINDDMYTIPRLNFSTNIPLWKFKLRLLLPY